MSAFETAAAEFDPRWVAQANNLADATPLPIVKEFTLSGAFHVDGRSSLGLTVTDGRISFSAMPPEEPDIAIWVDRSQLAAIIEGRSSEIARNFVEGRVTIETNNGGKLRFFERGIFWKRTDQTIALAAALP